MDYCSGIVFCVNQVAAMTERGQLATEDQRSDVNLLVNRLEELKMDGPAYKDEDMVSPSFSTQTSRYCKVLPEGTTIDSETRWFDDILHILYISCFSMQAHPRASSWRILYQQILRRCRIRGMLQMRVDGLFLRDVVVRAPRSVVNSTR